MIDFNRFKALTFDCYGTLIDWERGILNVLRPWAARLGVKVDDERLLEAFAAAECISQTASPSSIYPDILRMVHREMATVFGVASSDADADALANSIGDWPAFADTAEALRRLQQRFKLVIVSNVDRASFARSNEKLGVAFDAIVTAQDVGAYKPDHRMFQAAFDAVQALGINRDEILHVAQSLFHDHVPAKQLGLSSVWIDRRAGRDGFGATIPPGIDIQPDARAASMAEFVGMVFEST